MQIRYQVHSLRKPNEHSQFRALRLSATPDQGQAQKLTGCVYLTQTSHGRRPIDTTYAHAGVCQLELSSRLRSWLLLTNHPRRIFRQAESSTSSESVGPKSSALAKNNTTKSTKTLMDPMIMAADGMFTHSLSKSHPMHHVQADTETRARRLLYMCAKGRITDDAMFMSHSFAQCQGRVRVLP